MKNLVKWMYLTGVQAFIAMPVVSQTTFETHEVAKPFTRSAGLALTDVDRDGDPDILAGSGTAGFYWYENQGGKPLKWATHAVDAGLMGCLSVTISDIDKDGKPDLLATSWDDNSVFWYRNLGNQVWDKRLISSQCGNAHELFIHDMDGDGFDDVLVAAVTDNEILLYHNPGTLTAAWRRQQVSNSCGGSRSVAAGDLDGDHKEDIVGAAFSGNKITIWRNLGGNPVQWEPYDLVTGYNGAHRVQVVDLNQDGKLDVIGWGYLQGALRWWENTGPDFSKWVMHPIDNLLNTSCVGEARDIDLDGDLDVVSTSYANLVAWYENDNGKATTWKKHTIDTGMAQPWMAFAGDIDGDLDIDVIAGGDSGNEIRWYENHPSGRMDTYLNYSGGKMSTGLFLPEGYVESSTYELLIALPGPGDAKLNSSFRDHFIPVSESRNSIILTPDFPKASQPGFQFSNPLQINEIINYARTRFSVDSARIYLLGAACQGKPVLQGTLAGLFPVKGAIAINPEIQSFNPGEWTGQLKPLAIACSLSDPLYPNVETFADRLWQDGKKIKLISFDGPGSDYMTDDLADLTIRCLNYIDSANLLTGMKAVNPLPVNRSEIKMIGTGTSRRISISAVPGEQLNVSLIDISGRNSDTIYQGPMIGMAMEFPVEPSGSLRSGMYLIRVSGSESGLSTAKIIINK